MQNIYFIQKYVNLRFRKIQKYSLTFEQFKIKRKKNKKKGIAID